MHQKHIATIILVLAFTVLFTGACSMFKESRGPTAGQLAAKGKLVFQQNCAKCHGDDGKKVEGSPLMGAGNVLYYYQTGQGLYNFVSRSMPADNEGGLSSDQYLQVISYLFVQNNILKPDAKIRAANLDQISIPQP